MDLRPGRGDRDLPQRLRPAGRQPRYLLHARRGLDLPADRGTGSGFVCPHACARGFRPLGDRGWLVDPAGLQPAGSVRLRTPDCVGASVLSRTLRRRTAHRLQCRQLRALGCPAGVDACGRPGPVCDDAAAGTRDGPACAHLPVARVRRRAGGHDLPHSRLLLLPGCVARYHPQCLYGVAERDHPHHALCRGGRPWRRAFRETHRLVQGQPRHRARSPAGILHCGPLLRCDRRPGRGAAAGDR